MPNHLKRRRAVSLLKIKIPVKTSVKSQQIHQLFIQFINYVWWLLHVSALHCHLQGVFLVPSERCSIEEQPIEYCGCGMLCVVTRCAARHYAQHATSTIFYRLLLN